ncbi:MAG: phosphodiester glycosidase family protein [Streptococcus sp.]|nr:phosphodiester glycosidase family protein [Streptococcus sp.]
MSNNKKGKSLRKILTTAYTAVLIGASGMVVADTLFISKSLAKFSNDTAAATTNTATGTSASGTGTSGDSNNSSSSTGTSTTPTVNTATAYEDDTKSITIETYERNNTQIHVATVKIKGNASIKTALADETYGRNVTAKTSTTAKSVNAVLAINGDYYGARDAGYVVRNGQLLRSQSQSADQEDLVIYKDGSFGIIKEGDITAQQLVDNGAMQVLSFGPALIENGQVTVDSSDEVGKAMASNPRTAIGIVDDNTYVFVVSDGRTSESQGLSLKQLAEFMKELNVTTAYNLDGGGSSSMYFNGQIINKPTTNGRNIEEREVSDIVYL